jgi:hypothetical protein
MKIPATVLLTMAIIVATVVPTGLPMRQAQVIGAAALAGPVLAEPTYEIRVNAGGAAYTDSAGNHWLADQLYAPGAWGYTTGTPYTSTDAVGGTNDQPLYQSQRSHASGFAYKFDTQPGIYEVELRFAEIYNLCSTCRNFNVRIAGAQLLTAFDPMKAVGRLYALSTTFLVRLTGTQLLVELTGTAPIINALRVTSLDGQPQRNTVRINTGGFDYTDSSGALWVSDQPYVQGMQGYVGASSGVSTVSNVISKTVDQPLFQNNRYNMTGYTFDLANGPYSVDLLFAELYEGVRGPTGRVFDIWMQGTKVMADADVFLLSGGQYRAVTQTFTTNVINSQLAITFTKKASSSQPAIINAIAIHPLDMNPPGPWSNFGPSGWQTTTRRPAAHIDIQDAMSGLNVSSAQYAYSTNGGASYSAWLPASLSGTDGTTSTQTLSVSAIPFDQDSATQNKVKFRVSDVSGNSSESTAYLMQIDASPPSSVITAPAQGSMVAGSSFTIQGTANDSVSGVQSVEVSTDDGGHWSTATGTSNWIYNWTIAGDGVYSIRSRAHNTVGLVETPAPAINVTADGVAPVTFIRTPLGGQVISATTFLITGTAFDATSGVRRVELSVDGGTNWITTTGTTTWSYNWSPAGQGNFSIRARAVDFAGNVDSPGTAVIVSVDRLAPTSSITDPAPDRAVRGTSYTISGTASDGAGGSGLDLVDVSIDAGVWHGASGLSTWTYLWDPLPPDGPHTVQSRARDRAGNLQTPPFSTTIIVDNTPPVSDALLIGAAGDNGWYNSIVSVQIVATDGTSAIRSIYGRIDAGPWITYSTPLLVGDGSHTVSFYAVDQAGNSDSVHNRAVLVDTQSPTTTHTFSATLGNEGWYRSPVFVTLSAVDLTSGVRDTLYTLDGGPWAVYTSPIAILTQGPHGLLYRSVDVAGNTETVRGVSLQSDTVAPVATITSPTSGQVVRPLSLTIQGTASDGVISSGVINVEISINGSVWIPVLGVTSWTYPWTPPGPGVHNIRVRATDRAGNVQASDSGIYITVDGTAPVSSILSPYNGQIVPGPTLQISGSSADSNSTVTRVEVSTNNGTTWAQATLTGGGNWQYNWVIPNDGIYSLRSRATDQAGNIETPLTSVSVQVDSIAPVSQISSPAEGTYLSGASYLVSGTAHDIGAGVQRVEVSIDNGPWNLAEGADLWSYSWALLGNDGHHTIRSRATDKAGNVENPNGGVSVVVDNSKPASSISLPANGQVITGSVLFITGTSFDAVAGVKRVDVSFQRNLDGFYWDGGAWTAAEAWLTTDGAVEEWNYVWTNLPTVMMVTIRSRATDNMGNLEIPGAGVTVNIQRGFRVVLPIVIAAFEP